MGSMVSGLADAVLGVVEGVGLSSDTVARYGKCCEVVVEFCDRRDFDALPASAVEEFVACQQERARRGEIGRNRRNALVKTARMMLELQRTGEVAWRVMSPGWGLSESSCEVLEQFAATTEEFSHLPAMGTAARETVRRLKSHWTCDPMPLFPAFR